MTFSTEEFLKRVDVVNRQNYSYGNEILYLACKNKKVIPDDANDKAAIGRFSDVIWLIGKSYSADPMRSGNGGGNDGLGISYERLAASITKNECYVSFLAKLRALSGTHYIFDGNDADMCALLSSAECVALLNDMIKSELGEKSRNVISFCSKLLHFVVPEIFFITDSFSYGGAIALYGGTANRYFKAEKDDAIQDMPINSGARQYFKSYYPISVSAQISSSDIYLSKGNTDDDNKRNYLLHCLRAYGVSRFLHENRKACALQIEGDTGSSYMTRLTDSVLMRIK
jgi:hypothetical protein